MSFELLGIDFFSEEKLFGVYLCSLETEHYHRAMFCIYYDKSTGFILEIFFKRLIGRRI